MSSDLEATGSSPSGADAAASPGPSATRSTQGTGRGPTWRGAALRWRGIPATALAGFALVMSVLLQPDFLTPTQLTPFVATYVPVAILAVGVAFTLLVGGIDLSVGPVMGVCAILTVLLSSVGVHLFQAGPDGSAALCADPGLCDQGLPFPLVAVLVVLAGGLFGLVNGLVIAFGRLQPLVATLAMGFFASGFALYMMPQPGGSVPGELLTWYGATALISVPMEIIAGVALAAMLLMRTPLGVHMRAVGSHRWKAFTSGVHVNRVTLGAYITSGMCAGIAGVLFTLNAGSADPNVGVTYTLTAVAGAVLGGTALRGGWADPFGPAVGVFTLGLLAQLVTVADVPTYYAQLTTGAVILIGLTLTQLFLRRSTRGEA